jgi:hypothetical protein
MTTTITTGRADCTATHTGGLTWLCPDEGTSEASSPHDGQHQRMRGGTGSPKMNRRPNRSCRPLPMHFGQAW